MRPFKWYTRRFIDYRSSEDGYWYSDDGIIVCTMSHGMVWGIDNSLLEFDEMTEDPDISNSGFILET